MTTLDNALFLAKVLHGGQTDKAGKPYIGHIYRVVEYVRESGGDEEAQIIAALHDVMEDTGITQEQLMCGGFSFLSRTILNVLKKYPQEPYQAYISRVCREPLARLVKMADLKDNADPERLSLLDEKTRSRLTQKYANALAFMQGYALTANA